jgi:V-type H+-transporting ATPase subunit A
MQIGDLFSAGDILGAVQETSLFAHKILVPGNLTKPGKLIWLADDGDYTVLDTIAKLEYEHGRVETITMMHTWPVRRPRPIVARVDPDQPLLTGHRVIDGLFPCSLGGTACLPGAQGGKNTVLQSIARFSNTDISIYAACGGRTTDVGESVLSFSQMVVPAGDTDEPLMSRTCVVATSLRDSPAVHEISIYFAMTIAEYYRDQGSNVVFLLDSFYRWGDALRDIRSSGTSSFPPADQVGTPAFLKNTVTSFINRSGKVKCLGSPNRTGSVTLIGVVEPSSDPASEFAVESMQVYWKLDHRLAQKRHFPSINWTQSYSNSVKELEMFYDLELDPDFLILQERITNILKQEPIIIERINASTKIQDELKDEEKALIAASRLLRENFLQQNLFTPYDRYCPLYKTLGLMRVYTAYYDALVRAVTGPCKVSFALLREGLLSLEYKISNAKFAVHIIHVSFLIWLHALLMLKNCFFSFRKKINCRTRAKAKKW